MRRKKKKSKCKESGDVESGGAQKFQHTYMIGWRQSSLTHTFSQQNLQSLKKTIICTRLKVYIRSKKKGK